MSLMLWDKTAWKHSFLVKKQEELLASGEYAQVVLKNGYLYVERKEE
jgi:hypothetical protein